MRVIHAVRELNERRADPVCLIALHTETERDAMFVGAPTRPVCLAPNTTAGEGAGRARNTWITRPSSARCGRLAADAAWVGWGLVAEQPEFAELCERLGIVFVGPDPAVMRLLGDKIATKRLAERVGVSVVPWSGGPVATAADALVHAERIGFPLIIKAAAGREGRGIRRVEHVGALADAFAAARAEAVESFGDGTLLLEKLITGARHVEVQIIADGYGEAWPVGVRDCSYQRHNQKLLEESSSPGLASEEECEIMEAAQRVALHAGYRNAGPSSSCTNPRRAASHSWRWTPGFRSSIR